MLWNLSGEAERPFILEPAAASSSQHGHSNTVSAVLWIRDSDGAAHLVTASFDCRILVWSPTERQQGGTASVSWALRPEHSFCDRSCAECSASDHAHRGAVTALAMVQLDDAACVVSGCEDSSIKVWSLFGQLIRTVRTHTSGQHQSTGTKNVVLCCMSIFSW
jgi:WD40 repeat protein